MYIMKCAIYHPPHLDEELGTCPEPPGVDLVCGPMYDKVCQECRPKLFERCTMCGVLRVSCCC